MSTVADNERSFYLDALGLSASEAAVKTIADLRNEYFSNPPAGGGVAGDYLAASKTWNADPLTAGFGFKHTVNYATSGNSSTFAEVWYANGGSSLASFWLNENGAPRAACPKASDSAFKVVGWGTGQTVPTFMVQQRAGAGTGGRTDQWGIDKDGKPIIGPNNVVGAHVVVIAAADSAPPAGTPAGVVVFKLQS